MKKIVSLLTDFGTTDAYVGAMKGVILRICPEVTLVDLCHEVTKHGIWQGAIILSQASPYFPEGTIHLAVVDPGVGTMRRRIIVQGNRCFYVGPDNGILSLAVKNEGVIRVIEIKNKAFMSPYLSRTFEGRDVFAPVTAHLAKGVNLDEFGPEINNFTSLSISKPEKRGVVLRGEIIHVDGFGNIITNIPEEMLEDFAEAGHMEVSIGGVSRKSAFCKTYGEVPAGVPLLTLGSSGFLEVSVNRGSAKKLFKAHIGDRVTILPL